MSSELEQIVHSSPRQGRRGLGIVGAVSSRRIIQYCAMDWPVLSEMASPATPPFRSMIRPRLAHSAQRGRCSSGERQSTPLLYGNLRRVVVTQAAEPAASLRRWRHFDRDLGQL